MRLVHLRPISAWHLLLRCVHACLLSSTARLLLTRLGDAAFTPAADHCNACPPLAQQVVLGSSNRRVTVSWLCQACGLQSRTGYREAFQICQLGRQAGGMPTTALPIMLRGTMGVSSCKPPRVSALAAACSLLAGPTWHSACASCSLQKMMSTSRSCRPARGKGCAQEHTQKMRHRGLLEAPVADAVVQRSEQCEQKHEQCQRSSRGISSTAAHLQQAV